MSFAPACSAPTSPTLSQISISEILQSEAWQSNLTASPTKEAPSVPDNTPTETLVTLQIGCCTIPIMKDKVDYSTHIKEEVDEVALAGYIFNDPQGLHFYPIYVHNP